MSHNLTEIRKQMDEPEYTIAGSSYLNKKIRTEEQALTDCQGVLMERGGVEQSLTRKTRNKHGSVPWEEMSKSASVFVRASVRGDSLKNPVPRSARPSLLQSIFNRFQLEARS